MYEVPPPTPPVESTPRKGALQSAVAYLRRGLRGDGTYAGVDEWDVTTHQWQLLHAWAQFQGLSLPLELLPAKPGGREHDVRLNDSDGRWLKFTKPSAAGYAVDVVNGKPSISPATPLRYLERREIHNRLFYDDVELVGLRSEGFPHRIVVSQKDWGGDFPTWEQIDRAMIEDYGLERLHLDEPLGGYEARAYIHRRFVVFDVRPANCARSSTGLIVPFDVIPQVLGLADAIDLRGDT